MKKILLILTLCAVPLATFTSCTSKKDRLTADTLAITIDPSPAQTKLPGETLALKAICRNPKSNDVNISPSWSVENSLGTFNPASGKSTTFTAGTSTGTGKIYATYGTVRGEVGLTITSSGGSGASSSIYGLYSETYVSPTYNAIIFDTANPPNPNGGCIGAWGGAIGNLGDATGVNEKSEGTKSLKCVIPVTAGGWWIQFGSDSTPGFLADARVATDMSAFSGGSIKFDVRTTKDISIKLEWTGGTAEMTLSSLSIPQDNGWHSVVIPLSSFSGIDLTTIEIPAGFHTSNTSFTYYIDNVRWEK